MYSECNQNLPEIGIYKRKPTADSNGWSRYELLENTFYKVEYDTITQVRCFRKSTCKLFNYFYHRNG